MRLLISFSESFLKLGEVKKVEEIAVLEFRKIISLEVRGINGQKLRFLDIFSEIGHQTFSISA